MTNWSPAAFKWVRTASVMSTRNRRPPSTGELVKATSRAKPASFASPGHPRGSPGDGSSVGLCSARRGSRSRSLSLREPGIIPTKSSPSANSTSMPLIRGDPSFRSVASVLCLRMSKRCCTRLARAGSAEANSAQLAITRSRTTGDAWGRGSGRSRSSGHVARRRNSR